MTKSFSKVSSYGSGLGANHPEFQLGVSHDSLKEVWLESYPLQNVDSNGNLRPWQEMEVYDGDNCERLNESTVIKVRLLGETPLKSISQKQFVFFTTQLNKIEKILTDANVKYGKLLIMSF